VRARKKRVQVGGREAQLAVVRTHS
jgi:hypothetical protein